ncbi:MAG: SDR family oxidoreductase [Planctomycetota bacterium]|nr:SDR family oxidoreductase [Planctomycetota bacterium]
MRLLGKTALVTGAARGIGRGCALELARAGADVAINDRNPSELTDSLVAEIRELGRNAILVDGDIFERASCEQVAERAIAGLGRVDILVSNPAFSRRAAFLEVSPELWAKTLEGTLSAGFHMSQIIARHMVARGGGGKIVFISSLHARVPFVNSVAYNAAKRGVIAMAETIAAELLPYRINVNAIEPGWIDTPGERATFGDAAVASGGSVLPWGRLGSIHDIGKAAVFLSSDDADYITGTSLLVDGGLWLKGAIPATVPAQRD